MGGNLFPGWGPNNATLRGVGEEAVGKKPLVAEVGHKLSFFSRRGGEADVVDKTEAKRYWVGGGEAKVEGAGQIIYEDVEKPGGEKGTLEESSLVGDWVGELPVDDNLAGAIDEEGRKEGEEAGVSLSILESIKDFGEWDAVVGLGEVEEDTVVS